MVSRSVLVDPEGFEVGRMGPPATTGGITGRDRIRSSHGPLHLQRRVVDYA